MLPAGVEKALSFLALAVFGRVALKSRFEKQHVAGVQKLIMEGTLPCTIFKALCAVQLDRSLLMWPLLGTLFVLAQLAVAAAASALSFDAKAPERRTAALQLGTAAPGLSALVFVKEFVGEAYAGPAALFDLPSKLYLIFGLPVLLRKHASGPAPPKPAASIVALLKDPLNLSIVGGLLVAFFGADYASLGPLGKAATALAGAQTPMLFVLIGMKINLGGATPAVCLALLAARHAGSGLFFAMCRAALGLAGADALTLLLMVQAAVSVVGWGQMQRASAAGVPGYDLDLAFDIVGYSMPLTMALQTFTCLSDPDAAVARGATVVPAAFLVAFALDRLYASSAAASSSPRPSRSSRRNSPARTPRRSPRRRSTASYAE